MSKYIEEVMQKQKEEFDEICFTTEKNVWWDGTENEIAVLNAEHIGDVKNKLLPEIFEWHMSALQKQIEMIEGEVVTHSLYGAPGDEEYALGANDAVNWVLSILNQYK